MGKRLISTDIGGFMRYGSIEEVLMLLKKAGFCAYDCSLSNELVGKRLLKTDDYIEEAKKLREFADNIGIICNQSHGIYPMIKMGDSRYNEEAFKMQVKCLQVSSILGANICVVHPYNNYNAVENAEIYMRLLPYAEKYNIMIALENMWNRDSTTGKNLPAACSCESDFVEHLTMLPREYFGACLDIGHAYMEGLKTDGVTMIKALGERLITIHIHDNDGIRDRHNLPYTMNIPFDDIIEALVEIGYAGDLTFEAFNFHERFPTELYPKVAELMYDMGKYFEEKMNSLLS